jgi:LysM repeat protein
MSPRRRSPARFLAPIALIAVIVAAYIVVQQYRDDTKADGTVSTTSTLERGDGATTATTENTADTKKKKKQKKVYVVKPGDILSTVAEKTGLTVQQLQEYNPDIDPQALQVGQKLKLTASGSSSSGETDTTTTP